MDTTATTTRDDFEQVIIIRGLYRGVVTYLYDCNKHRSERENMIANRGLPKGRTEYGSEAQ